MPWQNTREDTVPYRLSIMSFSRSMDRLEYDHWQRLQTDGLRTDIRNLVFSTTDSVDYI